MTATAYVYRSDLLEPHTVPWSWSIHKFVWPWQRRPMYRRLRDGRWMQVTQVHAGVVSGRIMAWEQFDEMMAAHQRIVEKIESKTHIWLTFAAIGMVASLVAAWYAMFVPGYDIDKTWGLSYVAILYSALLLLPCGWYWSKIRSYSITDPGEDIHVETAVQTLTVYADSVVTTLQESQARTAVSQ